MIPFGYSSLGLIVREYPSIPNMNNLNQILDTASMAQRNMKLLESGDYHDFIIKCGQREFKVHRNIICPQSFVLATLCAPTWKEGSQGVAELNEEDPAVVEKVLHFLYTGNYGGECSCKPSIFGPRELGLNKLSVSSLNRQPKARQNGHLRLLTDVRVYILADYLDIPALKTQALLNAEHRLHRHFQPSDFVEPLSEALANTKSNDIGLRPAVVRACVSSSSAVRECPELVTVLQDNEPIAWTLLLEAQQKQEALTTQFLSSQSEVGLVRADIQNRKRDFDRANDNIKSTVKLVNTTKSCRNETCNREFGASLEVYANGYVKGLRCKRCNCRHSSS